MLTREQLRIQDQQLEHEALLRDRERGSHEAAKAQMDERVAQV